MAIIAIIMKEDMKSEGNMVGSEDILVGDNWDMIKVHCLKA